MPRRLFISYHLPTVQRYMQRYTRFILICDSVTGKALGLLQSFYSARLFIQSWRSHHVHEFVCWSLNGQTQQFHSWTITSYWLLSFYHQALSLNVTEIRESLHHLQYDWSFRCLPASPEQTSDLSIVWVSVEEWQIRKFPLCTRMNSEGVKRRYTPRWCKGRIGASGLPVLYKFPEGNDKWESEE